MTPANGTRMTSSTPDRLAELAASLGEPPDGGDAPATGDRTTRSASGRLAELAASLGEPPDGGDVLLPLAGEDVAWFVEWGGVDVFLVEYRGGAVVSSFKHLLRAGPGRLVFGVEEAHGNEAAVGEAAVGEAAVGEAAVGETAVGEAAGGKAAGGEAAVGEAAVGETLVAVARLLPGTALRRVRPGALVERGAGDEVADEVDAWIAAVSAAVARDVELPPHPEKLLGAGEEVEAGAGCVLAADKGLVWATAAGVETVEFIGAGQTLPAGAAAIPLTLESWIRLDAPARLAGRSSRDLQAERGLLPALAGFHRLALDAERFNRRLLVVDEANLQVSRAGRRRRDAASARRELLGVLARDPPATGRGEALRAALESIGRHEGIDFRFPDDGGAPRRAASALREILRSSGARCRQVRLADEDRWWRGDSGALLAFRGADAQPVALLPGTWGRYRLVDARSGRSTRVTRERARTLAPEAWCFYRPLPAGRPARAADLLRLAGGRLLPDGLRLLFAGAAAGLVLLTPAVAAGLLADVVIPAAAGGVLVQVTAALVVLAVTAVLLQMRQGAALMRIEGRAAARIGAATWDRLLGLPRRFFERFTPGDLLVRAAVFQALREQLAGTVAAALQSVVFLAPAFALIFLYDVALVLWSLGLGVLSLAAFVLLGLRQVPLHRRLNRTRRQILGDLFQFINGIGKLRALGAEDSAFARWARGYREQQRARLGIGRLSGHLVAFGTAVPAVGGAVLFGAVAWSGPAAVTVGDFLVVYAAAMIFYSAIVGLGQSAEALAGIIPAAEQAGPILEASPRAPETRGARMELRGDIRFEHVGFSYAKGDRPVLDDVSWHARPGELVALVGETGSGKSTLLRLALGLEEPAVGAVYLDGRDLAHLDRRAVRRQCGVVVQDGVLRHGNVLDNIVGVASDLTVDDAWRAARLADVDRDIEAMPMGMFTPMGSGGAVSGGQAQRIRIAAALVGSPRILLFDEATSWLDARSQARVMESLHGLAVTRVVIAHRLSTIRHANRIYVLRAGRVVQQGGFDELFEQEGVFRRMMRRQMV